MNTLRYLANIIGVVTITVGALTYIVTTIPEIRKTVMWTDRVKVVSFASHQPIALANTGDGDLKCCSNGAIELLSAA
jgi:hypothetical protein